MENQPDNEPDLKSPHLTPEEDRRFDILTNSGKSDAEAWAIITRERGPKATDEIISRAIESTHRMFEESGDYNVKRRKAIEDEQRDEFHKTIEEVSKDPKPPESSD